MPTGVDYPPPVIIFRLIWHVVGYGVLLLLSSCVLHSDARGLGFVQELTQVEAVAHDSFHQPPPQEAGWKVTVLPDNWNRTRPDYGGGVWYRVPVVLEGDATEQLGVFLPSFSMNASIWWDGMQLASGGQMEEPIARNWHRPLYASIPSVWAWSGLHWVYVHVRGYPNDGAGLDRIFVGDEEALLPRYEHAFFVQHMLSVVAVFATILLGLGALLLWLLRKKERAFLWIAVSSLFWAVAISNFVVRSPPMPRFFWGLICQSSVDFYALTMLLAVHAIFGVKRPRMEMMFALLFVTGWGVIALFGGAGDIMDWGMPLHSAALMLSFYPLWICLTQWRLNRQQSARVVGVAVLLQLVVAIHDWWAIYMGDQLETLLLMQFGPTMALLLVGGWMVFHFAHTLRTEEGRREQTEQEILRVSERLRREQEERLHLEQQRTIHQERERFVRELHDGLGGHLAALSSMVRGGLDDRAMFADTIEQALVDMRLVMDGFGEECDDVGMVVGMLRHRLERRLRVAGIESRWEMRRLPMPCRISPGAALHLLRILQEALTNVARHASASSVEIIALQTESPERAIRIEVIDNGSGFSLAKASGKGLDNMRHRAASMGGILDVSSEPGAGTRVTLTIPPHS